MTLLSPIEIIEKKPSVAKFFNERQLGYLLFLGLVRGRKIRRGSLICLEDVEQIANYKKNLQ
jgi:hypothetical protein